MVIVWLRLDMTMKTNSLNNYKSNQYLDHKVTIAKIVNSIASAKPEEADSIRNNLLIEYNNEINRRNTARDIKIRALPSLHESIIKEY